jgi:hypothetical protein
VRVLVTASREWDNPAAMHSADAYADAILATAIRAERVRAAVEVMWEALDAEYRHWLLRSSPTEKFTVVHGGARGGDQVARNWVIMRNRQDYRVEEEAHYAEWGRYGRQAGHRRNALMVSLDADVCLSFPLGKSPGTRGCTKMAKKAKIKIKYFTHPEEKGAS